MRLFLSDILIQGKSYNGIIHSNQLITLGRPHIAKRATKLRLIVQELLQGSYFSKFVNYFSVAGDLDLISSCLSLIARRLAKNSYNSILGFASSKGDGLVLVQSALLEGSKHIILKNTAHGNFFGSYWY